MSEPSTISAQPPPEIKFRYSGGPNVHRGQEPLDATNFGEFCANYLLTPILLPVTREEYHAAPKEEQNNWKCVPYFMAGRIDAAGPRKKAAITVCHLIALDLDKPEEAAPMVSDPGFIGRAIPWNHFAYHSASSTPEKPRIRIVVDTAGVPPESYRVVALGIAEALGLSHLNPESLNCSQPMYRPSVFTLPPGNVSRHEALVPVSVRLDGDPIPLPEPRSSEPEPDDSDFSDFSDMMPAVPHGAISGMTEDVVRRMLSFISPDVSRREWLDVLCGLKHQFSDDPETGFDLFNEWSMGSDPTAIGGKYNGHEATRYTWDSFKVAPAGGRPKTLRTARKMAEAGGWEPLPDTEEVVERLRDAINAEEKPSSLTDTLLGEIARENTLNELQRATLVQEVQARLKKLGRKVALPDLKKAVREIRAAEAREAALASDLPGPLQGWVFVASRGQYVRVTEPDNGINAASFTEVLTDQIASLQGDPFSGMTPVIMARHHTDFPKVDRQEYRPDCPAELFFHEGESKIMNTYRDTGAPVDRLYSEEAGRLIEAHAEWNIPDPEVRKLFLSFLAFIVQNPGRKVRWATFIQGVQGCGKSFWASLMQAMLGAGNVNLVDQSKLESSFSDWSKGSQFLVFDEILAGDDQKKTMERLKPVISEDIIGCTQKYRDSTNVRNFASCLFLSNYDEGIRIEPGDRRYFVLKSPFQTKEHIKRLPPGYFDTLFTVVKDMAGGARHFFLNYPLHPDFNPEGSAPHTAEKGDIVASSRNSLDQALLNMLEEGMPLIQPDMISSSAVRESIGRRAGHPISDQSLGRALKRLGFTKAGQFRVEDSKLQSLWISEGFDLLLEPGAEARKRLSSHQSREFDVEDEVPDVLG